MKTTERELPVLQPYAIFLPPASVILDIHTTGRFWRTSQITEIDLVSANGARVLEYSLYPEQESDEYPMLSVLSERLSHVQTIITFNGNAFDLPHLKHKYEAYGLKSPFSGKSYRDLFPEYKEYASLLALPSRKLSDYAAYLHIPAHLSDAATCLGVLSCDALTELFNGKWALSAAAVEDGHLIYTLKVSLPFLHRISLTDQVYYCILEGELVRLSVKTENGAVRRYYTNFKNYYYLPYEGYAVHKSMAAFVEKSHKEKAVRENCFSLITCSDRFLNDPELIHSYIRSVFSYLHSR